MPDTVFADAKRKAIYGHKDWLAWVTKDGEKKAARITIEALEQMIAEAETMWMYARNNGIGMMLNEEIARNMIKNAKYGIFS